MQQLIKYGNAAGGTNLEYQHFILFPILRKKQSIKKFTGLNMKITILNSV